MKTLVEPKDLTREVLVDFLSTATFGNGYIYIECESDGLEINDGYCREDVWATALLSLKKIWITDLLAEGEKYADSAYFEDDDAVYPVTIEDIRIGLERAINGDFEANSDGEKKWMRETAFSILQDDGQADASDAYGLIQLIMFGKVIYG